MAQPQQRPVTPGDALAELLAGNERFVAGARVHPHQDAERRAAVAAVQHPFAVVFGCSDSRLAAEIIFDRGLGDLFVVRTAGHIVGPEVLATIEYGVTVLSAPLVVVLGHDSCGAIQVTRDALNGGPQPAPGLRAIVDGVAPSVAAALRQGVRSDGGSDDVDSHDVAKVHVRRTIDAIARDAAAVHAAVEAGTCAVVGMTYRLADGRVAVSHSPYAQAAPPASA